MRTWRYIEPGPNWEVVEHFVTDQEILNKYYLRWCWLIAKKYGWRGWRYISLENCIMDFVAVHWASEVSDGNNR